MRRETKRKIYIGLFILLGFLLGMLVHGFVETWYIYRLLVDFEKYSLGYTWAEWYTIHEIFSLIIFIISIFFGYFLGKYWWRLVYEEKHFDPFFKKSRKFLYR